MQSLKLPIKVESDKNQPRLSFVFWAGLSVFVASLILAIAYHALDDGPRRTLCFDARQYIFDTSRIAEFFISALHGSIKPQLLTDSLFLESILADGPAFPTFFAGLFALVGHVPEINDCKLIQIFQSAMHAFSALFVYGLSFGLTKNWRAALAAGLAWGSYPAAIFWSGIFYTETTVIFFSLLLVSCLAMSKRLTAGFVAGLLAGIVALLKPALLPAAGLASFLSYRLNKKSFFLLILGGAVAIAPWMAYTKVMTGQAKITAQRFPAFNLAMGSDLEVEGCLVSPASPLTTMFSRENDCPIAFPLSQWRYHTADCLRLSAVKISALWSRQANDFRQTYFGINPQAQNIWHLLLLFCGITGLLQFLFSIRSSNLTRSQQTIALASLVFISSHFCYVLFTPAARYGLTSIPFFLVFASFAFAGIGNGDVKRFKISLAIAGSLAALLIAGIVNGVNFSQMFQRQESTVLVARGDAAVKIIDFADSKPPSLPVYACLLLVDGNDSIEKADIEINGQKLPGRLQHLRQFNSTLYRQSFELRSLGYPAGISTDQFRHWRAISIPSHLINWQNSNEIKIKPTGKQALLYADPQASRQMLSSDYFSVNSLCNSDSSLDLRIPSPILTAKIKSHSELQKQNGEIRKLEKSLRIKLAVALGAPYDSKSKLTLNPVFKQDISAKKFDIYMQDPYINGLRSNRTAIKAARSAGCTMALPALADSGNLRVTVKGEVKAMSRGKGKGKGKGKAEVVVALQPDCNGQALILNLSPQLINCDKDWSSFAAEDLLPSSLLDKSKQQSIYVAVYPGPWLDFSGYAPDKRCGDVQFRNLQVEISGENNPDIAGHRVLYY